MALELISRTPVGTARSVPLLFVHGTNCGGWIWAEHFLGFFADHGFAAYAVSLSGHGSSDGADRLAWLSLADYVSDIETAVNRIGQSPVMIGHSMGGAIVQRALQTISPVATGLICSVPPSGLALLSWRLGVRDPVFLQKVLLVQQLFDRAPDAYATVRRMLFSPETPEPLVARYFQKWQPESHRVVADLWWRPVPYGVVHRAGPVLVMGAEGDRLVDRMAVDETARFYGTTGEFVPGIAHAVMLEPAWERCAHRLLAWLETRVLADAGG